MATVQPRPRWHRPEWTPPGEFRPRMFRHPPLAGGRFREPGYAGVINSPGAPRAHRPWVEHRPGYTPNHPLAGHGKNICCGEHLTDT